MPATTLVVLERSRKLERQIRQVCSRLPVEIRIVRSVQDAKERLQTAASAILFAECIEPWESVLELAHVTDAKSGWSIFVTADATGPRNPYERLIAAGATLVWESLPSLGVFRASLEQLVTTSQERLAIATGVPPTYRR